MTMLVFIIYIAKLNISVDTTTKINELIQLKPVFCIQKACNKTLTMSCHFTSCDRPSKYGCGNLCCVDS